MLRIVPENNCKFVASDSADNIMTSTTAAHQGSGLFQNLIARVMAVNIVVLFKVIDIENEKSHSHALIFGVLDNLPGEFPDISSVLQAR